MELEALPTEVPSSPPEVQSDESMTLQQRSIQEEEIHPNFTYNKHNESIFDDIKYFPSLQPNRESVVKFDAHNPDLINSATLKALVVQLTSPDIIDYNFICDFFLTYRIFTNSESILNLLLTRFVWCLQYIKSNNEFNLKIGKLSLLRTFVVLRHWLLNYFIDDFEPNPNLCDIFITFINNVCLESNLINNSMVFERRIINDLKIHWVSLLNEFWKVNIELDSHIKNEDVLNYKLPLIHEMSSMKNLSKSNTEISIHTNPSYRRSAMLSLYDQKVHHKCLIIDDSSDENPQFSVNNLLLQYHSSRVSLNNKLQEFQLKKLKDSPKANLSKKSSSHLKLKHNYMSLKDSSTGLKKVSAETNNTDSNNKLKDQGITILTPTIVNDSEDNNENNTGFSTNGHLKLPTSKVQTIVPPTPVKKMEYRIKQSLTESPKKSNNNPSLLDPMAPKLNNVDEFGRKRSIKKLVDGWKKTFNHGKSNSISNISQHSTCSGELDMLINNAMNVMTKEEESQIGERVDILSARIIDELEYLIRYYIHNESSITDTINEGDDESIRPVSFNGDKLPDFEGFGNANQEHDLEEFGKLPNRLDTNTSGFGDEFIDVEDDLNDGENAIAIVGSPTKKHKASDGRYTSIVGLRSQPLRQDRSPIKNNLDKSITEEDNEESEDEEININNLSDLNIGKIDNLINIENENVKQEKDILSSLDQLPEPNLESDIPEPNLQDEVPEPNLEDEVPQPLGDSEEATVNSPGDSKEVSFQRPTSINWNDDELIFENSESPFSNDVTENNQNDSLDDNIVPLNKSLHLRLVKSSTQYFDVSSELPKELHEVPQDNDRSYLNDEVSENNIIHEEAHEDNNVISNNNSTAVDERFHETNFNFHGSNGSFGSSISTPSNLTQYDAEVAELGIALSPQLMNKEMKPRRISFNEPVSKYNNTSKRVSRNSSGSIFKRDSIKSYVSYDSAFSFSNASFSNLNSNKKDDDFDNGLKKKTGYANLRMATTQVSTGLVEYKEEYEIEISNFNHEVNSLDLPVRVKSSSLSSMASRSSSVNRKSIRVSTLGALTELPFKDINDSSGSIHYNLKKNSILPQRLSRLSDIEQSSIFSVALRSKKNSTRKSQEVNKNGSVTSSTNSVAIPGISNYVLKELAAIPDESIRSHDPIEFALSKLEGKPTSHIGIEKDFQGLEGNDEEVQRILNEINNANTEDVIEFSSDIENMTQEPPLTPIKNKKSKASNESTISAPLTSTPRKYQDIKNDPIIVGGSGSQPDDIFYFGDNNTPSQNTSPFVLPTPKVILDGYNISSDLLAVVNVMNNDSHISFILSYDSKSLANHFTMIEKDMLQEIDWKELIELKWNKELTPVNSWLGIIVNENYYNKNKGVNLVISRFNLMVNWIISEILLTNGQEERINIISRFIHIAQNCYGLQNFSTLMQIILALTSEKILKLKDTWKSLPPGDILMLKNLEELSSPIRNFLNIRLLINQLTPSKGCIPFVGLYLSDLIFNAERPKYIKKSDKVTKTVTNKSTEVVTAEKSLSPPMPPPSNQDDLDNSLSAHNNTSSTMGTVIGPNAESDKIINFSRFRTSVHIVKSLSQCIEWSNYYKFKVNDELLSKCLYIKSLDEDEMNYCLNLLIAREE